MTTSYLSRSARLVAFGLVLAPFGVHAATAYIPLARAVLAAPIVAKATARGQHRPAKPDQVAPPGLVRTIIDADLEILYKAPGLQPPRLSFLWEGEPDFKDKVPKFKNRTMLLFLAPEGAPGGARAAALGGQIAWSAEDEATIRAILSEATADPTLARLHLTTLRLASVTDTPEARGEVQFLIDTAEGAPISLVVRGDNLFLARSDTTSDALPVQANSLIWLHLSCDLPEQLPESLLADQPTKAEARKVSKAYATIRKQLGACT